MLWLWRLRMGYITTAVAIPEMTRPTSKERPDLDARLGALGKDVVGVVEQRVVEQQRRDGRRERDQPPHSGDARAASRRRIKRSSACSVRALRRGRGHTGSSL